MSKKDKIEYDIILIGAGIMSATLGMFLKILEPNWSIAIIEKMDRIAGESSDGWNNAGTGHSGLCELNYCPEIENGTVDISKAEKVAEQFELSKQFWSFLIEKEMLDSPTTFINSCPHMSLVFGAENIAYLKKRYEAMMMSPLFEGLEYSDNQDLLSEWFPLIMEGRNSIEQLASTRSYLGTDVDFGSLTRAIISHLCTHNDVTLFLNQEVKHLHQDDKGMWSVEFEENESGKDTVVHTPFVFIGAGGGSLPLLEKSGISEGDGFGGFPVSGEWLRCNNKEAINRHAAKVYGKASVGSPPMSVPHLDTRIINGEKQMLFGPYAGFSTKFLKQGSFMDLPLSIRFKNIIPMLGAGIHNKTLTEYLVNQVTQSPEDRFKSLLEYYPLAKIEDWELVEAGQRVQIIKKDDKKGGVLEFGTEVVTHDDGSIAALLGASPGASTSVSIMLQLLEQCFKGRFKSDSWQKGLKEMVPTFGNRLAENRTLCQATRKRCHGILELKQ